MRSLSIFSSFSRVKIFVELPLWFRMEFRVNSSNSYFDEKILFSWFSSSWKRLFRKKHVPSIFKPKPECVPFYSKSYYLLSILHQSRKVIELHCRVYWRSDSQLTGWMAVYVSCNVIAQTIKVESHTILSTNLTRPWRTMCACMRARVCVHVCACVCWAQHRYFGFFTFRLSWRSS